VVPGLFEVVLRHVDTGLGEPEVLVDRVPLALELRLLFLHARDGVAVRLQLLLRLGELLLELGALRGVDLAVDLLDLGLRALDVHLRELLLVLLPFAIVVRPDHEREDDQEADRRQGEDDVEDPGPLRHLGVASGLGLSGRHRSSGPRY